MKWQESFPKMIDCLIDESAFKCNEYAKRREAQLIRHVEKLFFPPIFQPCLCETRSVSVALAA